MKIINNPAEVKALIVGAPNLCKVTQMPSLVRHYTMPLDSDITRCVTFASIGVDQNNKYLKKTYLEDVDNVVAYSESMGINIIGVTNPKFYQFATGDKQFMANIGKAVSGVGVLEGYVLVPLVNYFMLLSKPEVQPVLEKGVETLNSVINGTYDYSEISIVDKVSKHIIYTLEDTKVVLKKLLKANRLTMDIETTGLTMGKSKIITVALADSTTNGYSFPVCEEYSDEYVEILDELSKFIKMYKGRQVWHNAMFDIPFIMREVLKVPFTNQILINSTINDMDIEDTMHIVYLCNNSTSRQSYKLKELLYDKYGEYDKGIEQDNLLAYSYEEVATYNILDVTGTMEVYNEYYPKMVKEGQLDIFNTYYKPSLKTLLKLKYRGVNVDVVASSTAKHALEELVVKDMKIINSNSRVNDLKFNLNANAMFKYNSSHKKQKTIDDFDLEFNPASPAQKAILLFDIMELPILETTAKGNPATGKDVIKQLITTLNDEKDILLLETLLNVSEAAKISSTFLKAFEELSIEAEDGTYRIHGDYKLSGTVSGRLSSANPNLQNLPAGSTYGKLIKGLFPAPSGKVFWGSDYNALETHVGAILTHDVALRKILLDGYDSHSLYTAVYFADELKERGLPYGEDITAEESFIIKEEAPDLRQQSKTVTFGLQYGATFRSVAKSLSCSNERAEEIVASYHKLHGGVTAYYKKMTDFANKNGYYLIETGLKLRAPGLQSLDEHIVSATERSAENALIQGFGMLTVRAMNKLQIAIEEAGMEDDITIIMNIHDAIYGYCTDDVKIIKWLNEKLVEVMVEDFYEGQDIKLKAEMDIGYSWKQQHTLDNNCSLEDIEEVLKACKEELNE